MNQQDIYIHVVLDESGSMYTNAKETVEGFNRFIADQSEQDGFAYVSLTKFNTRVKEAIKNVSVRNFPKIKLDSTDRWQGGFGVEYVSKNDIYSPSGGTALNDAVVKAIRETEDTVLKVVDKEVKVLVVVITDGQENSSVLYPNHKSVAKLIDQKTDQGWGFLFLGADQDAWANSSKYGFSHANSVSYKGASTTSMYAGVSSATSGLRSGTVSNKNLGNVTRSVIDSES